MQSSVVMVVARPDVAAETLLAGGLPCPLCRGVLRPLGQPTLTNSGEAVEAPEPEFAGVEDFDGAESCLQGVSPECVRAHQGSGSCGVVVAQ